MEIRVSVSADYFQRFEPAEAEVLIGRETEFEGLPCVVTAAMVAQDGRAIYMTLRFADGARFADAA